MDTTEEAEGYDAMDHAEANAAFVERAIELAGGQVHGWWLDLGTGPGEVPVMVCDRLAEVKVVGVDLSWEMLKLAQRRQARSAHADRMLFQIADVKALPFVDQGFDAVLSNTILHHIPEPAQMLREAARVLRPGGVLLIRDLYRPGSLGRLRELVEEHVGDCTGHQKQMFAGSLHAALTPDELRRIADASGFRDASVTIDTDRHMSLQRPARGG